MYPEFVTALIIVSSENSLVQSSYKVGIAINIDAAINNSVHAVSGRTTEVQVCTVGENACLGEASTKMEVCIIHEIIKCI